MEVSPVYKQLRNFSLEGITASGLVGLLKSLHRLAPLRKPGLLEISVRGCPFGGRIQSYFFWKVPEALRQLLDMILNALRNS